MIVKMCGIRRMEDAEYANEVHPDYVGFVFAESKRKVTGEMAAKLREKLGKEIRCVGVFVNEEPEQIARIAAQVPLDVIQLHGDEGEEQIQKLRSFCGQEIWKAARVRTVKDMEDVQKLSADRILLDSFSKEAYGGTGKTIDLDLLRKANITKPYLLAGGLTTENLKYILDQIHPEGIDLSSGIETDGCKDLSKMREIMKIAGGNDE